MITYMDKTFCTAKCKADCNRKYTAQVQKNAERWWGSKNAPIALANLEYNCKDKK